MAVMHNSPGRHAQSQAECVHNSAGTHAQRPAVSMHFPGGVRTWRNDWMLKQSDYVITYITHSWGGAAQYSKKASNSGKFVVNLCDE